MNKKDTTHLDFTPKYYRIKNKIIEEIKEGKYLPGSKLPSIREMIKEDKVAYDTARHVIRELVREGYVYTVQGSGCRVAAEISDGKISKLPSIKKSNNRVVFISMSVLDDFYGPISKGILDVLQSRGFNLEICNSEGNYSLERKILSKYLGEEVSGIIFMPSYYNCDYRHLLQLKNRGVAVILLDTKIKGYDFDYVGSDNSGGAKKAVKYLIKAGHRKIVFTGRINHNNFSTAIERYQGYKEALKEAKIPFREELVLKNIGIKGQTYEEIAYKKMKEFLNRKIDFSAVFAGDDAFGTYRALKEKGIRVPEDVSLITFTDSKLLENFEVPMTCVGQDAYRMGYNAAKLLIERVEDYRRGERSSEVEKVLIPVKLIIRKSVMKFKKRG